MLCVIQKPFHTPMHAIYYQDSLTCVSQDSLRGMIWNIISLKEFIIMSNLKTIISRQIIPMHLTVYNSLQRTPKIWIIKNLVLKLVHDQTWQKFLICNTLSIFFFFNLHLFLYDEQCTNAIMFSIDYHLIIPFTTLYAQSAQIIWSGLDEDLLLPYYCIYSVMNLRVFFLLDFLLYSGC